MMGLGLLAATGRRAGISTGGADWSLDFLTETYLHSGSPVAIATLIDHPEFVGAGGLQIPEDDPAGVAAVIGDLLTDLLTMSWTAVIEFEVVDTDFAIAPLWIDEDVGFHYLSVTDQFSGTSKVMVQEVGFIVREVDCLGVFGVGVHRIAFTRTSDFESASVDGGSVQRSEVDVNYPAQLNAPTQAGFGGPVGQNSYNNMNLLAFDLYLTPLDDAALPGLSA